MLERGKKIKEENPRNEILKILESQGKKNFNFSSPVEFDVDFLFLDKNYFVIDKL